MAPTMPGHVATSFAFFLHDGIAAGRLVSRRAIDGLGGSPRCSPGDIVMFIKIYRWSRAGARTFCWWNQRHLEARRPTICLISRMPQGHRSIDEPYTSIRIVNSSADQNDDASIASETSEDEASQTALPVDW